MATVVKKELKPTKPAKGNVEDAAKVLKQSQQKGEGTGDEEQPEIQGDAQPAEDLQQSESESPKVDNEDPWPIPTAEQIEEYAKKIASNTDQLDAIRQVLKRAEEIASIPNTPVKMTAEDLKAANHTRLVATYGKDFVTARKGNNKQYYTRKSWSQMGKGKMGWTEVTETMPEVAQAATEQASKTTA